MSPRRLARLFPHAVWYCVAALLAVWCTYELRDDLVRLPAARLLQSSGLIACAAGLSVANYLLRALRWRKFLIKLGHRLPVRFAVVTYVAGFAYTLIPAKVGELARARYYTPLGVRLADIVAAFFTERLLDILVMAVLAGLLFAGRTRYDVLLLGAITTALTVVVLLPLCPWSAVLRGVAAARAVPDRLRGPVIHLLSALQSTRPLLRGVGIAGGCVVGLVSWGGEGVGLWILGSMFPHVHLEIATGVGVYAVAVIVGAVSFLPGGLGSTEAVMTALLAARGYSVSEALLMTLTCRLVTLWLAIGLGWLAMCWLRGRRMAPANSWL